MEASISGKSKVGTDAVRTEISATGVDGSANDSSDRVMKRCETTTAHSLTDGGQHVLEQALLRASLHLIDGLAAARGIEVVII